MPNSELDKTRVSFILEAGGLAAFAIGAVELFSDRVNDGVLLMLGGLASYLVGIGINSNNPDSHMKKR